MSKKILFVCTGNTCRSAMAQYLAVDIAEKEFSKWGFLFDSAGLAAATGCHGSEEAVAVLYKKGIDMSGHTSKSFEKQMLDQSDYIIGMTGGHYRGLLETFPEAKEKVFTLGELSGSNADVRDPFCGSMDVYAATADLLESEIRAALKNIEERLS